MTKIVEKTIVTFDGYGSAVVEVRFAHTLSESDNRPEFNLDHQWAAIRRAARTAVVDFIAEREQKTGERLVDAKKRIRASLGKLEVHAQNVDGNNIWHGVTFQESD